MAPKEWDNCHSILKKALAAAPEADRPPPPYHLGGPTPTCPALGQIRLAVWAAEVLAPTLQKIETTEYKRVLALARALIGAPKSVPMREWMDYPHGGALTGEKGELYTTLSSASVPGSKDSFALLAARSACGGSASFARGKPDLVFTSAQSAVAKVVKQLAAHPGSLGAGAPGTAREAIAWVDLEIVRLECAAAMSERAKKTIAVERVVWRGGAEAGKKATHFLAQLRGGSFGLVTKLGPKWAFIEGTKDSVLATVPDALFAEVALAAK